jgi:hypothetical protein
MIEPVSFYVLRKGVMQNRQDFNIMRNHVMEVIGLMGTMFITKKEIFSNAEIRQILYI